MENKNAPQIVMVEGVHGFVDEKGVVWVNVEDIARGLGFVQVKKDRVPIYTAVRWERINAYRAEFGFPPVKADAELKCVYAFLMSNTLVKVGFTGDVKKRRNKITGVRRAYSSPFVTESEARDIERRIKEKFFAHKVAGEFYNITFKEAVAEIKSYFPAAPFDENKVRLLIDLLNVPIDCPEKTALFRRAANLLLEEKFF